jgi:autotransporter-associated beta strand protein
MAVIGACCYATLVTAQPITFNVDIGPANRQYVGLAVAPTSLNQPLEPAIATNWNNMAINGFTSLTISNIKSSLGNTFPGVNVRMFAVDGGGMNHFDTTGNTTPNPVDLMRDYSFFHNYIVQVSGLPAGSYDLWFYGHGDQANQTGVLRIAAPYGAYTNSTANDALGRDLINGGEGISYLTVSNLTVGTDGLLEFGVGNYMNGFQLRPSQPQGPAFLVTGTDACSSPGVTPGTSGSVTTNNYMLYRDGVYDGQTLAGTGSALAFTTVTTPGNYTIVATNPVTGATGLMFGKVRVYAPGVAINTNPSSVSVVTNLPASFTVTATGDALTYQWLKNGVPLANGGNISGATSPTLKIAAAQVADAATSLNGYACVVVQPCAGAGLTSSPPAALTLLPPRNLIWAGGNPGSDWNYANQEFTLAGSPTAFQEGDNVTFNDTGASYPSVTLSNNVTATLVAVSGTTPYTLSGPGKLTGVTKLAQNSSGTLTIKTANNATGGATVGSGSTLSLGDGSSGNAGSMLGVVDIASGGTLHYNYNGSTVSILNSLAGSGTNNCSMVNGGTMNLSPTAVSSNFTGVININGFLKLQAPDNNGGYALGNGATVNIEQDGGEVYLGIGTYSNIFNVQGLGFPSGDQADTAIRAFGCTINGQINLLADTRIGGWWNTSTINAPISGAHQLEVKATFLTGTARYKLNMAPVSPHSYASTYIRAGTIGAMSSNAISTGPLMIDTDGELSLNGNNLTVASLTSAFLQAGPGATIDNNGAATGILTVGTDGSSTQFDGLFRNTSPFFGGGTAPLGLTKVGAGTLTLTANNTSTGPITVSGGTLAMSGAGAFDAASSITVVSGGTYDVTAATGTLNRGSGTTLAGNGNVSGNVSAAAGSTINPGLPMGTLSISGSAAINGTYTANLDRGAAPNCSKISASGGLTFSGATLTVTNVGAALQLGDAFQLFSSGTAGITFSGVTVDTANNVQYTWTDEVSTLGKITVASAVPLVNTNPTNITAAVSGSTLTLSWPASHLGWSLQAQTNNLGVGLSNNWVTVPGSAAITSTNITIDPSSPSVFFRLRYP